MILKRFVKPYTKIIIFIVILSFGQVIADLLLPNFMAKIVDEGIALSDIPFILRSGGYMLLIALGGILCALTAGYLASRTALGVARDLREAIFKYITDFSLAEFNKIGTSSLITRTTNDVQQIQQTTFSMLRMMLRAPLMCIGGIIMAVQKDGELSLLLLAVLPFIGGVIFFVLSKAVPLFRIVQSKIDGLNLVVRENLTGIRIIRAFSRLGYEKKRFKKANDDLTATSVKAQRVMAIMNPSINFLMNLLTIVIVWMASFRIENQSLQVGDMMAFIQYAMQIFMALTMISMMFVMLPRAFASAERINDVFKLQQTVFDPEQPKTIPQSVDELRFKEVTFRFDNAENPAVSNVSFSAKKGDTIAIIGSTGSGKTALINLIPRYYDPESGSIEINGINIKDFKQRDLRELIGLVPQKATIFSGSINHNIRIGKQKATEEEIEKAAGIAQAAEFIDQLPERYNTIIAQDGSNLSGGQKQRLSIARALVKAPPIYLFDDSFSALDFKTDAAVRSALYKETRKAIVIIVAQRITSIQDADKILVMDNGKLVGEGTHAELLKSNSIYKEIVLSQRTLEE